MKILMLGRGVISTLYGWALTRAGHTVDFLVRSGRAAEYGPSVDLEVLDARTNPRGIPVGDTLATPLREGVSPGHNYDLIIVSVRHDRFAEAALQMAPWVGKATVLVFNNLWAEPLQAAAPLPQDQVVWGFPVGGGGFDEDGVLQGSLMATVHFGTLGTPLSDRDHLVRKVFSEAGFALQEHRDFRGWLWLHFVVNAGFSSQGLEAGGIERMLESPVHAKQAIWNIRELFPVVAARGVDLNPFASETLPFQFPAWLGGWILQNSIRGNEPVRRVMVENTNEEEPRLMCRDVLAEARRLGVAVPRLEAREPLFTEV